MANTNQETLAEMKHRIKLTDDELGRIIWNVLDTKFEVRRDENGILLPQPYPKELGLKIIQIEKLFKKLEKEKTIKIRDMRREYRRLRDNGLLV